MSDVDENAKSANENKLLKYFKDLIEIPENFEDIKKFGVGMAALVLSGGVVYIATTEPKALTEQFYYYCFFIIMPVILGAMFSSNILGGKYDITKFYFYCTIAFVFIISAYLFRYTIKPGSVLYVTYLLGFLSILVFIFGLAIVYRIFVRTIINIRGWTGFFLKFLFLIPCLLIELLETVFTELKEAPKMIVILFILEILIILAYIYIPRIKKSSSDSIVLLNKPVFLTQLQSIGNATQFFMETTDANNPSRSDAGIRINYSISMWFYVNKHPNTLAAYSKETNILRFGNPVSESGHPKVTYFNDTKDPSKSDKFIVYVNDNLDLSGVLLDIPTQSWNNLVISYNDANVDIFVNGNLEKSISLANKKKTQYDKGDIIEVGYGDNTVTGSGLHGAICNVVYHKTPLTPFQVAGNYNINRYNNPPVN